MPNRSQVIKELPPAKDFDELCLCLLVQAFGGRPVKVIKPFEGVSGGIEWIAVVSADEHDIYVEMPLNAGDLNILLNEHERFMRDYVGPALNNLDNATFPYRFKRFMKAAKRSVELLPMPRSTSTNTQGNGNLRA